MKQIKIKIDAVGRPTIEAEGFAGIGCKDATKPIEDVFRGAAMETEDKPEINHIELEGGIDEYLTT